MQKSPFETCLAKAAAGDTSLLPKLGDLLAEWLCFLPIHNMSRDEHSAKVQAVIIDRDDRTLVPVFTSEPRFKEWAHFTEHKGDVLPLLGGELCAVLGRQGVIIDPLTDHTLELSPDFVPWVGLRLSDDTDEEVRQDKDAHDPFDSAPPGMSAQSKFEESAADSPDFPHEGTPESYNPSALDPVTGTIVSETHAFREVIGEDATAKFEQVPGIDQTVVVPDESRRQKRRKAPLELDRDKRKRSFFSFFRSKT